MDSVTRRSFVPLEDHVSGAWLVGDTGVTFEQVIQAHESGATPEVIVATLPALDLADVYGVIAHFLRHRDEFTTYLQRRRGEDNDPSKAPTKAREDLADIRRLLLARRSSPLSGRCPTQD